MVGNFLQVLFFVLFCLLSPTLLRYSTPGDQVLRLLSPTLLRYSTPGDQVLRFECKDSRHYNPSNHQEIFTHWLSVTSQKTWIRSYHLLAVIMFGLWDTEGWIIVCWKADYMPFAVTHIMHLLWWEGERGGGSRL